MQPIGKILGGKKNSLSEIQSSHLLMKHFVIKPLDPIMLDWCNLKLSLKLHQIM